MDPRVLVPLPAPLERALEALRHVQPPPPMQQRLRATLERVAGPTDPTGRTPRLVLLGSLVLALLMDLPPWLAAAQAPQATSETGADTASVEEEGSRHAESPPRPGQPPAPPAQLEASLMRGVRFVAPELADFTVELHASAWFRGTVEVTEDPATGETSVADYFSVPLVRPQLALSAFDGLVRAFIQAELAGAPRLLDAQLELAPDPAFAIRVGQYRTPFTRAFGQSLMQLDFPDRGFVANQLNPGRDIGLMIYGTPLDGSIEYYAGVFNGSGIDGRIGDTPVPMVVGRFVVVPVGKLPYTQTPSLDADYPEGLAIAVNGYYREREVGAGTPPRPTNQQTGAAGTDVAVAYGPFYFQAEGFLQDQRFGLAAWTTSLGAYAQAGLFVIPRIFEASARAGCIDPNIDAGPDLVQTYEAAFSGYFALDGATFGQHLKLVINYRFADNAGTAQLGDVPQGSSHRVIAQAQLWA